MGFLGGAIGLVLLFAVSCIYGAPNQAGIDAIADNLGVIVELETSYTVNNPFQLKIIFRNKQNAPIWTEGEQIYFSLNIKLENLPHIENQLRIEPSPEGHSYYIITPLATFQGVGKSRSVTVTLSSRHFSLTRYNIHPRWTVWKSGTTLNAKTIMSTDDNYVKFVKHSTFGKEPQLGMTAEKDPFQRVFEVSKVRGEDLGQVSPYIYIPSPKFMSRPPPPPLQPGQTQPEEPLVYLSEQKDKQWDIVFPSINAELKVLILDIIKGLNVNDTTFNPATKVDPSKATIQLIINRAKFANDSKEAYSIVSRKQNNNQYLRDRIILEGASEIGLLYAVRSLQQTLGRFDVIPEMDVWDDAYLKKRSLSIDLTINCHSASHLKRYIEVMSLIKMNELELKLGGDEGWRLEMEPFAELTTVASRRCVDHERLGCLPPSYGSGQGSEKGSVRGSCFFKKAEFVDLLKYAGVRGVKIVTKINLLGSLRSAIVASRVRYARLHKTNPQKANEYNLSPKEEALPDPLPLSEDSMYTDGTLNPCLQPATRNFLTMVVAETEKIYKQAGHPFEFNAGGDDTSLRYDKFPACIAKKFRLISAKQWMIEWIEKAGKNMKLRVDEEAVVNPSTRLCFKKSALLDPAKITVVFRKTRPGSNETLELSKSALDWLYRFEETPRFTATYGSGPSGMAAFSTPYACANTGYQVIMAPDQFLNLDNLYELGFNELGSHQPQRFATTTVSRILMLEPKSIYANMDLNDYGLMVPSWRLCRLKKCVPLLESAKQNVIGIQASIDGYVLRTMSQLSHKFAPCIIAVAQRGWSEPRWSGLVTPVNPSTYLNETNVGLSRSMQATEVTFVGNTIGYKEMELFELNRIQYRIPTVGAYIENGFQEYNLKLPPWPVVGMSDIPGTDFVYKDKAGKWQLLDYYENKTKIFAKKVDVPFDKKTEVIEIRALSSLISRRSLEKTRKGPPIFLEVRWKNVLNAYIPPYLRRGTTLPVGDPGQMPPPLNKESLTGAQWKTLLRNLKTDYDEQQQFAVNKDRRLQGVLNQYTTNKTVAEAFYEMNVGIQANYHQVLQQEAMFIDNQWRQEKEIRLRALQTRRARAMARARARGQNRGQGRGVALGQNRRGMDVWRHRGQGRVRSPGF